jgi:signal transduction histidine kinase
MRLSLKYKIPLFFSLAIIIPLIIFLLIISFINQSKIPCQYKSSMKTFIYENYNYIVNKDQTQLFLRVKNYFQHNPKIKDLILIDNKYSIIYKHSSNERKDLNFSDFMEDDKNNDLIYTINNNDEYLIGVNFDSQNQEKYIIWGIFEKTSFFKSFFYVEKSLQLIVIFFILLSIILSIYISILFHKEITAPITEIIDFINNSKNLSPDKIKNIKIKNNINQECQKLKNSDTINNSNVLNENCWDRRLNSFNSKTTNPLLAPCFNCKLFLKKEKNDIEQLKIFLNYLISKMVFHYNESIKQNKNLETKIHQRTLELQEITDDLTVANLKTQMIIENVAEGIIVVDKTSTIIQFNQQAKENLFIKGKNQIFGSPLKDIINNKKALKEITSLLNKTLSLQKGLSSEVLYDNNKNKKHLYLKTSVIENEYLGGTFIIILIRDYTNEKIIENFKNDFFHMICHDLKNPLTSILGFLDLLLNGSNKENINEKQKMFLNYAKNSAQDLKKMLEDLNRIIKLNSIEMKLKKNIFLLEELFEDIEKTFYPKFKEKNTKLKIDILPNSIYLKGDYQRLKQAFSNLINSTLKSGNNISLEIHATESSSNVLIIFSDNGQGIPEEKLPILFESYTQLYTCQEELEDNNGLGLSIVKKIINLHNGDILVDSKIKKGTTFTITLPKDA